MDVDVLLDALIEDRHIGENDKEVARMCLLLIKHGWKDKDLIREQVNLDDLYFEMYWDNLEKNGYFLEDGSVDIDLSSDVRDLLLMILVAEGYVERVQTGG